MIKKLLVTLATGAAVAIAMLPAGAWFGGCGFGPHFWGGLGWPWWGGLGCGCW